MLSKKALAASVQGGGKTVAILVGNYIRTIDITDPSNMVEIDSLLHAAVPFKGQIADYDYTNNILYVPQRLPSGVATYDISDASNITLISSYDGSADISSSIATCALDPNLGLLFVGDEAGEIHTLDVSDPANISYVTAVTTNEDTQLEIDPDNRILMSTSIAHVRSFNYDTSGNLTANGYSSILSSIYGLEWNAVNRRLYIARSSADTIYTRSISTSGSVSGTYSFTDATNLSEPMAMAADTDLQKLIVACTDIGRLTILNLTNGLIASVQGTYATTDMDSPQYGDVALDTNRKIAFVGLYNKNFISFDYSGSGNPTHLQTFNSASSIYSVFLI